MSRPIKLIVFFVFCTRICAAMTFEEFRRLRTEQQSTIVADENNKSHQQLIRWWWRLRIGERAWQYKEEHRLIDKNGFPELIDFLISYQHLRHEYLAQDWHRRESGILPENRAGEEEKWKNEYEGVNGQYFQYIHLVAGLSPTVQVQQINEMARNVTQAWDAKYPQATKWVITRKAMEDIEHDKDQIINQLESMDKLPPMKIRELIDKLPEDDLPPRGLLIPHSEKQEVGS